MKILLVHPGASWSTADVEAGLRYGLEYHGVQVFRYRFDARINAAATWLNSAWRKAKKVHPEMGKPTQSDILYQAGLGVIEKALRNQVDVVLIVSAMYLHPDIAVMLRRAGLFTVVLFTEAPYDIERELEYAALVDGCWTTERSSCDAFQHVNANSGYLAHAWHPELHAQDRRPDPKIPAHDVVFVGSAWTERVNWFKAIDWTGIDLGLYGSWEYLGPKSSLRQFVRGKYVQNESTAHLYRRAKIGLNLYRKSKGFARNAPLITHAESMSPRGYELCAVGAFHISEHREEVQEICGDLVPTFHTSNEAEALIRRWLPDEEGRKKISLQLPSTVEGESWTERAKSVIGDLQTLLSGRSKSATRPLTFAERTG